MERLSKVLAKAGVASRRGAEELIADGRVTVNGALVTEQGLKVDPEKDRIKVDGRLVARAQPIMVIALNKPQGYVTTADDPEGRPTVQDLIKRVPVRVFPIGRLDWDAEGLLLFTNDGELSQRLMHPRYKVEKSYVVKVKGLVENAALRSLAGGLELDDGRTAPARAEVLRRLERNTWLRVTIREGRRHQVKRMCEAVGHPVIKLMRERFGPIRLGDLKKGRWRQLDPAEEAALRRAVLGRAEAATAGGQKRARAR